MRRSSTTSSKRKLTWEEQGAAADLSAFDAPRVLGGPGDKRIRDFGPRDTTGSTPPPQKKAKADPGGGPCFERSTHFVWKSVGRPLSGDIALNDPLGLFQV